MLRTLAELEDYSIGAIDGTIGQVKDFYFDDEAWVIRYFVVETGSWLSSRKVLISPLALGRPNSPARLLSVSITGVRWEDRKVSVSLTRDAVRGSPPYAPASSMGRDEEARINDHYGRPGYWAREVQLQNPEFRNIL